VLSTEGHQALFEHAPELHGWGDPSLIITPRLSRVFSRVFFPGPPPADLQSKGQRLWLQSILEEQSPTGALSLVPRAVLGLWVARLLLCENLYLEAEKVSRTSLSAFREEGDSIGELLALLGQAEAAWHGSYFARGRLLFAEVIALRQAVETAPTFEAELGRMGTSGPDVSRRIAMIAADLLIDTDPMQVLSELERAKTPAGGDLERARILFLLAVALWRLDRKEAALANLTQARALSDELAVFPVEDLTSEPLFDGVWRPPCEPVGALIGKKAAFTEPVRLFRKCEAESLANGSCADVADDRFLLATFLAGAGLLVESKEKLDLAERAFQDLGDLVNLKAVEEFRAELARESAYPQ
jgi:hypothetical protein